MFVPAEVHNLLVACLDRFLAVRMMGVEGCSEDHSSAERPVREIPRWTLFERINYFISCHSSYG